MADMPLIPTPYTVLYDSVESKIGSYDFINLTEDEVHQIIFDYLRPSIVKFNSCKQNIKDRDDTNQVFKVMLTDDEVEILSFLMVIEYFDSTYLRVPEMLKVKLTSKEFNAFSDANFLEKIKNLREMYKSEVNQLMSRYSILGFNFVKTKK